MTDPLPPHPARDAAIRAMLPDVAVLGWTQAALRAGTGEAAIALFPGGPAEMVEAYIDLADREMAGLVPADIVGIGKRVRALILARLAAAEPHREAVRRGFAVLALPGNYGVSARTAARTIEAIWAAAGDVSTDFSWYTKRVSLGAVYAATLLFWLGEATGGEATAMFLDRQLAGLARVGRLRSRAMAAFRRDRQAV